MLTVLRRVCGGCGGGGSGGAVHAILVDHGPRGCLHHHRAGVHLRVLL